MKRVFVKCIKKAENQWKDIKIDFVCESICIFMDKKCFDDESTMQQNIWKALAMIKKHF